MLMDSMIFNLNIIDRLVNTNDYTVPVKQAEPTHSIVEVHQLEPPDPKESNSQIEAIFNKDVSQSAWSQTLSCGHLLSYLISD